MSLRRHYARMFVYLSYSDRKAYDTPKHANCSVTLAQSHPFQMECLSSEGPCDNPIISPSHHTLPMCLALEVEEVEEVEEGVVHAFNLLIVLIMSRSSTIECRWTTTGRLVEILVETILRSDPSWKLAKVFVQEIEVCVINVPEQTISRLLKLSVEVVRVWMSLIDAWRNSRWLCPR